MSASPPLPPQADAELFRRLVQNVHEYAIFALDADGTVATWNPGAELIKGYTAAEIVGRHFSTFYTEEDVRNGKPLRGLHEARTNGTFRDEGWRVRKDGTRFWASVTIDALYDDGGAVRGFAKVTRDLTERRAAEEAERDGRRAAEHANRLKDEFLATVSHELRTPLNVMSGGVWRLKHGKFETVEERDRLLDTLDRNLRLLTRLVADLLDTSRMLTGKAQLELLPVELGPVVDEAVETVRPAAIARSIQIHQHLGGSTGPILGDAQRLQQIFWNLIANAVKFTDPGGSVTVRVSRVGTEAVVQVQDTGRGIPADFLPHVFDRFTQADSTSTRQYGGMGLGLAIARHLTEAHGGRIVARSGGIGQGATFDVYFPIPALAAEAGTAFRGELEEVPNLAGISVLVVDDERDAREAVSAILDYCGATSRTAASASEALRTLRTFQPSVILADIAMPDVDGLEMLRLIREQMTTRTPAAALTAFAGAEDRVRVLAAGYQLHIAKPADPLDLARAVEALARSTSGTTVAS